jgi:hypothetical protein
MSFLKQCLARWFILARQLVIQLAIFLIGFSFPFSAALLIGRIGADIDRLAQRRGVFGATGRTT